MQSRQVCTSHGIIFQPELAGHGPFRLLVGSGNATLLQTGSRAGCTAQRILHIMMKPSLVLSIHCLNFNIDLFYALLVYDMFRFINSYIFLLL